MNSVLRVAGWALLCLAPYFSFAQSLPTPISLSDTEATESLPSTEEAPLDDVVARTIVSERRVLPFVPLRESDVLWERRVWRIIDVREKLNLPFVYPEAPLFTLLAQAALRGDLPVYSTENEKFTKRLDFETISNLLSKVDTVAYIDPVTYEETYKVIRNDINHDDVKRFRLKEVWYFDKQTSTLRVRILGIAPMLDVKDQDGNFRYEAPLFWVHYPQARSFLGQKPVFLHAANTRTTLSWEDLFEMRYFASHIYKASNVHDRKLPDYLTAMDALFEGERIRHELINAEHDLWQF